MTHSAQPARGRARNASRGFDALVRKAVQRSSPSRVVTPSSRARRAAAASTVTQPAVARPARSASRSSAARSSREAESRRAAWRSQIDTPGSLQRRPQPLRRHLPLGVHSQHEAPPLRPEPAHDAQRRGRGHGLARRRQPALARRRTTSARRHSSRDPDVLAALQPRAGRRRGLDHDLGRDRVPIARGAAPPLRASPAFAGSPRLRCRLQARGP